MCEAEIKAAAENAPFLVKYVGRRRRRGASNLHRARMFRMEEGDAKLTPTRSFLLRRRVTPTCWDETREGNAVSNWLEITYTARLLDRLVVHTSVPLVMYSGDEE